MYSILFTYSYKIKTYFYTNTDDQKMLVFFL